MWQNAHPWRSSLIGPLIFPVIENSGIGAITDQLATAAWTAWAIPLLITEAILQDRKMLNAKPIGRSTV